MCCAASCASWSAISGGGAPHDLMDLWARKVEEALEYAEGVLRLTQPNITISMDGAVTGRMQSRHPNVQNIPRRVRYK